MCKVRVERNALRCVQLKKSDFLSLQHFVSREEFNSNYTKPQALKLVLLHNIARIFLFHCVVYKRVLARELWRNKEELKLETTRLTLEANLWSLIIEL